MSAWTSPSRACSPRAWWCTRPIAAPDGSVGVARRDPASKATASGRRAVLLADGAAGRDRLDREDVEVEEEHRRPRRHHRRPTAPTPRAGSCCPTRPPERDVIWTEEGVQGASRFVQRLWRLTGEIAGLAAPCRHAHAECLRRGGAGGPQGRAPGADPLRGGRRAPALQPLRGRDLRARQRPQRRDRQHRHGKIARRTSPGRSARPARSWCRCSPR